MGKLTRPKLPYERLQKGMAKAGGQITAEFARVSLEHAPAENGHIHEAVLTAVEKTGIQQEFPAALEILSAFSGIRSRDPEASKRGIGQRRQIQNYIVRMTINLPFAAKMDKGGNIHVGDASGNRGRKVHPMFPGPLYGSRDAEGSGVLMWIEGGSIRRAKVRAVPAHGFWKKAAYAARAVAARLGLKER